MIKILLVLTSGLAALSLTLAIVALERDPHAHAQDPVARRQLASAERELRALQSQLGQGSEPVARRVGAHVAKIATCLPEIQNEINGLSPTVSGASVYLENTAQISAYCSATLTGMNGG